MAIGRPISPESRAAAGRAPVEVLVPQKTHTAALTDAPSRDHLFISYAWEDQAFARWLALRLTAEGIP